MPEASNLLRALAEEGRIPTGAASSPRGCDQICTLNNASINPGNSGGALVDQQGRLVGINTANLSRSGGNVGIGFAIPINMVRHLVDQIITYGAVQRGQLGVVIQDLTPDIAEAMRVDADGGAVVSHVIPDTAADRAGLIGR